MAQARAAVLIKLAVAALLTIVTQGCATSGSMEFDNKALTNNLSKFSIVTENFDLTAYANQAATLKSTPALRIYLAGDGRPFFRHHYINPDPTSTNALALELLLNDLSPAILLGRPCYHKLVSSRGCNDSKWWTSHRYSEEVVRSMGEAVTQILDRFDNPKIELVGFSGGGTLAVLLAQRLPVINSVLAINPNLNTQAWTEHHGYTPLSGSINPYANPTLPDTTTFTIWVGEQDNNVLARHWLDRFSSQRNAMIRLFPDNDHVCCWLSPWRTYLSNAVLNQDANKTR